MVNSVTHYIELIHIKKAVLCKVSKCKFNMINFDNEIIHIYPVK